ncbi:MAG: BamA/TamA family outer membrane protein [Bryobacteraceae bacterium]
MITERRRGSRTLLLLGTLLPLAAQQPATRIEVLEQQRAERNRAIAAESQARPESEKKGGLFSKIDTRAVIDALSGGGTGLSMRFGGLVTGSGFGLGPEYYRPDLANGNIAFRAFAVGSIRKYYLLHTSLSFPRIYSNRFAASVEAERLDAPRMHYFGPGWDSRESARSSYRLERTTFDSRAAWRPTRESLQVGITGGLALFNTGPGQDPRVPSVEMTFTDPAAPASPFFRPLPANLTPGLDRQTSFFRGGPFVELDLRDRPEDPHKGTHFLAQYRLWHDRNAAGYSFRRLETSAEHYIPFFNRKRVIAFRAGTELSFTGTGQQVPFYLQSTLGGSDNLRGFHRFRFHGNHSVITTAEYRWEVIPALDMAIYGDAGKVFDQIREFDLRHSATSFGLGFRVKNRGKVVVRLDTGYSREGFQVWLKFRNVF